MKHLILPLLVSIACLACDPATPTDAASISTIETAQLQCGKDTDCKGDRICDEGTCKSPGPSESQTASVVEPGSPDDDKPVATSKSKRPAAWDYVQAQNGDSSWYCGDPYDHRQVHADLNGDGKQDTVVVFVVEGNCNRGNAGSNNVAVFLDPDTVLHDRLNADGVNFDKVVARTNSVELTTLTRTDDDPQCCPSLAGKLTISVSGGKILQQQE